MSQTSYDAQVFRDTIEQQRRASDPHASIWVAANAGTGKTYVLIQRIVRLLLSGAEPQRILCLTFTNAAAAEMSSRLFDKLGEWATASEKKLAREIEDMTGEQLTGDELPKARRLFARALETPGGLKIQTIHAFCQRLLGRFPLEAAVPPHFELLDERTSNDLLYDARQQLFEEAASEEGALNTALLQLISRYDERGISELLDHAIAKRNWLAHLFAEYGDADKAALQLRLDMGLRGEDVEEGLKADFFAPPSFDRERLKEAAGLLDTSGKNDKKKAQILFKTLEASDIVLTYDQYRSAFITKGGTPYKDMMAKGLREAYPQVNDALIQEQGRVAALDDKLKSLRIADDSWALFTLAKRLLEIYEGDKKTHRGLDYDDLILRSGDLLRRSHMAAWVLYKLDGGLDHILVDEAQDTSPDQWHVIEALADEFFAGRGIHEEAHPETSRTLFVVGDEKQSIYAFQGADPEKFYDMRQTFSERVKGAGQDWRDIDFTLSFRSTTQILDFVDTLFKPEKLRASLTARESKINHQTMRTGHAGHVEFWSPSTSENANDQGPWNAPLDAQLPGSPTQLLASEIADLIQGWLKRGDLLESQNRPIEPGDVMILVRRRRVLVEQIIRELKARKIPVAGMDRMRLTEQLAVKDLLALADFVLQTGDDLALAEVLKSPLVGVSEEDLFQLAHDREGGLWSALRQRSEEGQWKKAYGFLTHCLARADQVAPFEFFQQLLDGMSIDEGMSGRSKLLERLGQDANDPLDEFLNVAITYEKNDTPSLQGFVHWMRESDAEIKRQLEQVTGEVRIMTVHGSKGLDANIVILPDTCQGVASQMDDRLLKTGEGPLLLRPSNAGHEDALTAQARARYAEKRDAEYARLLYVASTRARDRLYVMGHHGSKGVAKGSWYEETRHAVEAMKEGGSGEDLEDRPFGPAWHVKGSQEAEVEKSNGVAQEQHSPIALPDWIEHQAPQEAPPQAPLSPSRLVEEGEFDAPSLLSPVGDKNAQRFLRGGLVHKILEFLPDLPEGERVERARSYLATYGAVFSEEERAALLQETLAVIETPAFSSLFQPGSQAEVALSGIVLGVGAGARLSGKVDRLWVGPDSVLVVDYKTNRPPPQKVKDVAPLYLRQMAVYRALLQSIFPGKAVACALLWTDGPRLMDLPSSLLDETLNKLRTLEA